MTNYISKNWKRAIAATATVETYVRAQSFFFMEIGFQHVHSHKFALTMDMWSFRNTANCRQHSKHQQIQVRLNQCLDVLRYRVTFFKHTYHPFLTYGFLEQYHILTFPQFCYLEQQTPWPGQAAKKKNYYISHCYALIDIVLKAGATFYHCHLDAQFESVQSKLKSVYNPSYCLYLLSRANCSLNQVYRRLCSAFSDMKNIGIQCKCLRVLVAKLHE